MKKFMLFAALVCMSLFGNKVSAQNPTFTIINNTSCAANVHILYNWCTPSSGNATTIFTVPAGSTVGPLDATMVTWTNTSIPAPNPATMTWDQFEIDVCTLRDMGQSVCFGGTTSSILTANFCVSCSAQTPKKMVVGTVTYSGSDATVTLQ